VWVGLPIALFLGLGMVSSVNIGIRHLLPLYPFAFVVGGLGLARIAARAPIVAIVLVSVQIGEALWTAPHGLAYFNVLGGGREGGYRVLLDSNFDWGQHDGALRDHLADVDVPVSIDPDPLVPRAGRIVVGASALHGLLGPGPAAYAWLRDRAPLRRIESTWFEYEVGSGELADAGALGPSRRQQPTRIALARHVLRSMEHPDARTHPRLALDVAVACNAALEYACALDQLRTVLRLRPAHRGAFWLASEITARRRLGVLLFEGREYLDGFRPLDPAKRWLPADVLRSAAASVGATQEVARLHRALGGAAFRRHAWSDAVLQWDLAHALEPAAPDVAYRLGWLLATCPEEDCRDGARALELARVNGEARGWVGAGEYDLLAVALAELGRFAEARDAGRRALDLARGRALRGALEQRLEAYAAGRAHRLGPAPARPERERP
jgi:hypothetical protein